MLTRRFRRSPRRRLARLLAYVIFGLLLLDTLTILKEHRHFTLNLRKHTYTHESALPTPARDQKIFICSQHWTNAAIIESRWGDALLALVDALGADNVYVSIYESGSIDHTKDVLRELDAKLAQKKVARTTVLDDETHEDLITANPFDGQGNPKPGWLLSPSASGKGKGKDSGKAYEFRRIPFLARIRNLSLQPLFDEKEKYGRTYDKILFLNDAVFKPEDVLSLLATNGGSYSVACALDYHYPAGLARYYDTFVLRDSNGDRTSSVYFPYFKGRQSRQEILRGDSVKVKSCWNGMILMDASPFYPSGVHTGTDDKVAEGGLRFRAISDSLAARHLEGSECCLIHADMTAMGAAEHGMYVNPAVRVGYTEEAYNRTHIAPEAGGFLSSTQYFLARWRFRLNWLEGWANDAETRKVRKRVVQWKKEEKNRWDKREEIGGMCLIDEMQFLIRNGWRHA